jgi:hypothetical protein
MRPRRVSWPITLVPLGFLMGCGDNLPLSPPPPCTGSCVPEFRINLENLILTTNDTVRLGAQPITADGRAVGIKWAVWFGPLRVDSAGLVTPLAPGKGGIIARASTDSGSVATSEIWVVHPDTSAQPFIAVFRDAATGDTLLRRKGFRGHDSVDITVSYVVGNKTETVGPPFLTFQIRTWVHEYRQSITLSSLAVPLPARGRGAFTTFRVHLTEKTTNGARRFPTGFYDFFILLPLADGTLLGDKTGYPVSF